MDVTNVWNDQIPEKDGVKLAVNDVAFSPDGSKVIAAVGNRVLLYRSSDGDLIDSLRGHKDTVYCVSFSSDGSRFASGGADNVVVIWKSTGQGLLKYNHSASIQKVKYNPSMLLLASCSEVDFGLWTPDQKQVTKEKVPARILSSCWSTDGSLLALGLLNGLITIRNQQAEEVLRFERKAPIWSLAFIPEQQMPARSGGAATGSGGGNALLDHSDNLAVGCWDKTYSLYRLTSKNALLHVEKNLPYYPLSMHCVNNPSLKMSYMVVTGSNKQVQVLSREGIKLAEVTRPQDSWVWCADSFSDDDTLCFGSHFGSLDFVKLDFKSVHSLYRDRYAYRENLTEVIVHHLVTEKKVRIKCKDMIHNLSLYRNKLAVQLLDRICIYESSADDFEDIHFRLKKERIILAGVGKNSTERDAKIVSNLMVCASNHVFVSMDGGVLEMYSMDGTRQRLWRLDHNVTFMKVDGGPEGSEGVLIAQSNGAVLKVYVDNPFPVEVTKRASSSAIHKVDVNVYRTLIATVDAEGLLVVSDMHTQETVYTLQGVKACAFNSEVEDLLCITNAANNSISVVSGLISPSLGQSAASAGNGLGPSSAEASLAVAVGRRRGERDRESQAAAAPVAKASVLSPEVQEQHLFGLALGFRGQKIFSLLRGILSSVDLPQGANIMKALEAGDFPGAYKVACLGATEADWRLLAMKALRCNQLVIAKSAFSRLKDSKYLSLIETVQRHQQGVGAANNAVNSTSTDSGNRARDRSNRGGASGLSAVSASTLDPQWLAEIMAYEGHFQEAAKILARAGRSDEAISMFTLLRRWEDAKAFARNSNGGGTGAGVSADVAALTAQQAKWLQEIRDWRGAAELFCSMGQYAQAARIVGDNEGAKGWTQALVDVLRQCPAEDADTLVYIGEKLSSADDIGYAKEAFLKAKDLGKLMALYVSRRMWIEAAALADENVQTDPQTGQPIAGSTPRFDMSVFLSYADWLITQDRYEEAMDAYKKCGRRDLARKVLAELTENSVTEKRFKDAGYYYWLMAREIEIELSNPNGVVSGADKEKERERLSMLQSECEHKADLYYAYSSVHAFVTDPFTSFQPEMLFQVSRFIINSLGGSSADAQHQAILPQGLSKTSTLYTLAKQAMLLGAFKLARNAFERLSKLTVPDRRTDEVELDMLLVQAKPVRDDPDILPVCYRCGTTNPLLNPFTNRFAKGDVCTNCGHPFVRSFINFDILPLVEFVPEPSISDEEAIDLIRQPPNGRGLRRGRSEESKWREDNGGGSNVLTLTDDADQSMMYGGMGGPGDGADGNDLFSHCLNNTLERQKNAYTPVQVDASALLAMKRSEVFVCKPSSKNKRATFYKNMLPDIPIAISQTCHRFFHLEDFEFAYLSEKKCPYSRLVNVGEYGSI